MNAMALDHDSAKPVFHEDIQLEELREKADEALDKLTGYYGQNILHQATLALKEGRHEVANDYFAEYFQLDDDYKQAVKEYYRMATCKHEHATQSGSRYFDGEPVDDIRWVCDTCGKVLD